MPDPLPDFNKLWNYNDPAATEQKFRELLPAARSAADVSYELQLLTQIARCQGLQSNFTEAHATLDQVQGRLTPDLKLARVRYLLERGRLFNSAGHPAEAMPLFQDAFNLAKESGEMRFAVDALHMVAIAAPSPDERARWNQECLKLIDATPGQDDWLPSVLNNLGEAHRARGDYPNSLACFQRILDLDRQAGRQPWLYNRVDEARLLRLVGRTDEALTKIRALASELKDPDGFIEEELAESLIASGRADDAKPHSTNAWQLLQKETWLRDQEPHRWERLITLGLRE